jgi:hypothetical protein
MLGVGPFSADVKRETVRPPRDHSVARANLAKKLERVLLDRLRGSRLYEIGHRPVLRPTSPTLVYSTTT